MRKSYKNCQLPCDKPTINEKRISLYYKMKRKIKKENSLKEQKTIISIVCNLEEDTWNTNGGVSESNSILVLDWYIATEDS